MTDRRTNRLLVARDGDTLENCSFPVEDWLAKIDENGKSRDYSIRFITNRFGQIVEELLEDIEKIPEENERRSINLTKLQIDDSRIRRGVEPLFNEEYNRIGYPANKYIKHYLL